MHRQAPQYHAMTSLTPMTDDKIRVRIAEACGYSIKEFKCVGAKYAGLYKGGERVADVYLKNKHVLWRYTPNYLHSLDACHEMEKSFTTGEQWSAYYDALDELCSADDNDPRSATARQRATAFVKTLNLEQNQL